MKGFIKKVKNNLKFGVVGLLLAGTITTGAAAVYSNIELADYSTEEEIEAFAEEIGADLSYSLKIDDHYVVMKHNGDEPIYICFDENITKEEKSVATEAIDYVFSFISQINSNYKYEIVDKQTYSDKFTKTRIYFSESNCENVNKIGKLEENRGLATRRMSVLSKLTNKRVTKEHTVQFNRNLIADNTELKKVFIHELAHNFSKKDVYTIIKNKTTEKHYGNSFMLEGSNSEIMGIISPNDLKTWAVTYSDDNTDKQAVKKMMKDYENYYYQTYANYCKNKVDTTENVSLNNFQLIDELHITDIDGTERGYEYRIVVENSSYEFYVYDLITGKQLEQATGKTENINGTIILRDVELKKGLRPFDKNESYEGGYVKDFIVLSKDDKIGWFDLSANDFRSYGTVESLEKDMGL